MTRSQIRYVAHQMRKQLEWLDRHVAARTKDDRQRLEDVLRDLDKSTLKLIGTYTREPRT